MGKRALVFVVVLAALGASTGSADVIRQGGLLITFNGEISPRALPRERATPVRIRLQGLVRSANGSALPRLRRFSVAVHREGRLRPAGVPRCPFRRLEDATGAAALDACRGALVGRGRFGARVSLPEQAALRTRGVLLAFNSRYRGRPALLLHVYARRPAATSVTVPIFLTRRSGGPYGTQLTAPLVGRLGANVYATDFTLNLGGRFAAPEARRYVSASCGAPRGFTLVSFPLARTTFHFEGNRRVTHNLTRSCRVRR